MEPPKRFLELREMAARISNGESNQSNLLLLFARWLYLCAYPLRPITRTANIGNPSYNPVLHNPIAGLFRAEPLSRAIDALGYYVRRLDTGMDKTVSGKGGATMLTAPKTDPVFCVTVRPTLLGELNLACLLTQTQC